MITHTHIYTTLYEAYKLTYDRRKRSLCTLTPRTCWVFYETQRVRARQGGRWKDGSRLLLGAGGHVGGGHVGEGDGVAGAASSDGTSA